MKTLTDQIIAALERGETVVLCTILASSGSAPRGAGARMAVFADGTTCGTVGGGRVEYLAAEEARDVLRTGRTQLRAFSLAPDQVASIGMICGGNVTIYYQRLTQAELPTMQAMRAALSSDEDAWLFMQIERGNVTDFRIVGALEAAGDTQHFTSRSVLENGEPLRYYEPLAQSGRVYIFGGGHVGQALVPVLAGVDFRVTLFDNREELATRSNFPAAESVIYGSYEDIFSKVTLQKNDYAVVMTPGHQSDYALLEQLLRHPLRYVGCIGSRHKVARTQQLLREAGIPEERILSVHSPIGLSIGAQTPAEIAISIAAEMIQCRAEHR